MERFIRIKELASVPGRPGRLPLSPNSVWRLVRQGRFPKPLRLSPGCTAWLLEDVRNWEMARREASA